MASLCLIIPCYNEADRLDLADFEQFINKHSDAFLCFVDDGSKDHTKSILEELVKKYPTQVFVAFLSTNQGKAGAIRHGIHIALSQHQYNYVGYFDADLSTPLHEAKALMKHFENNNAIKLVLGSRIKRMGSVVKRNEWRHYIGRVFATFASMILRLPIYDTQCGAKIMSADLAEQVFREPFRSRWLFDIEILARMIQYDGREAMHKTIFEHPLNTWLEKGNSRIKMLDIIRVPFKLLDIYFHYQLYKPLNYGKRKQKEDETNSTRNKSS